jgi:hypothetical protein
MPKGRPDGKLPNPRTPKPLRQPTGNLNDLFALFKDLPRPPRPASKVRKAAVRRNRSGK